MLVMCIVGMSDVQVLYKLAYTSSCKRDMAAEDWHKKYDRLLYFCAVFMSTLVSRPNKVGLKCPSVCTYLQ